MDGFPDVFGATIHPMPGHVFYDVRLTEVELIALTELCRLDGETPVMIAAFLSL